MFENLDGAKDLFVYRLGTALTMEHDSLDMLQTMHDAARQEDIRQIFASHAQETRQQIENLESVFALVGVDDKDRPSPTTHGLSKEGESLLRKTSDELHDDVAVSAALEAEHFEIAVYETLLAASRAMGEHDITALLAANLRQEEHARDTLKRAADDCALALAATARQA